MYYLIPLPPPAVQPAGSIDVRTVEECALKGDEECLLALAVSRLHGCGSWLRAWSAACKLTLCSPSAHHRAATR